MTDDNAAHAGLSHVAASVDEVFRGAAPVRCAADLAEYEGLRIVGHKNH